MLPQRINTALQKRPKVSAATRLALRWWIVKSQALLLASIAVSLLPLFVVPLFGGASLRDSWLLFTGAGSTTVIFCCGFLSIGYLLYALAGSVFRRHVFICSRILSADILLLSLSPSVVVLLLLYYSDKIL
jgi:hypothetical protein